MRTTIALVALAFTAACASAGRQAAWEQERAGQATSTATSAASSSMEAADAHWAKRDDRAELEKAIATWEEIVKVDPNNPEVYVKLSRAHYFLADGHLSLASEANEEQDLAIYTKGVGYGEQALLRLEPDFESTMRAGGEFEDAIRKISVKGVPAAYWYCANLGRFATRKGLSTRLYYKDKLKAAMETIQQLDSKYFYGGADRYLGGFYAVLPSIAGKDLDKSKAHFEAALQQAPEYLVTRAVQAEFLAVELDDEEMYRKLLGEVMKGDDTTNPDIAPENRAAKKKAEKMLANIGEVF